MFDYDDPLVLTVVSLLLLIGILRYRSALSYGVKRYTTLVFVLFFVILSVGSVGYLFRWDRSIESQLPWIAAIVGISYTLVRVLRGGLSDRRPHY